MSNISRSLYDCNSILLYLFTWGENLAQVSVIAIYAILEAQLMYYNQVSVICFMLYNIYTLEINGQKIMWIGLLCSCIGPSALCSRVTSKWTVEELVPWYLLVGFHSSRGICCNAASLQLYGKC
jgi:hypothetical protein